MIQKFAKACAFFIAVPAALIYPTLACSEETLVMYPVANKAVCKSLILSVDHDSVQSELCVLQGSFAHDKYMVKLNGSTILQGIEDQTTSGIRASYKGKAVVLHCPPQNIEANATPTEIQKLVPGISAESAKKLAELLAASSTGIELGRLCQISIESEPVMKVQVIFE